jgi:predicted small lipoprotein YifL
MNHGCLLAAALTLAGCGQLPPAAGKTDAGTTPGDVPGEDPRPAPVPSSGLAVDGSLRIERRTP